jgi:ribose transport system substrate-binding protein
VLRRSVLLALCAAACVAVGACGDDSSPSDAGGGSTTAAPETAAKSVDVGGGQKIEIKGERPKIAFFIAGSSDPFLIANIAEIKSFAKEQGLEYKLFDAQFDAGKQVNQMATALQSGQYNAWVLQSLAGDQECDLAAKKAPAAGIVVSVVGTTVCGRDLNAREELWAPGTLNYIGPAGVAGYRGVAEYAAEQNPGAQKVLVITPPPLLSLTRQQDQATKEFVKEHPNFDVVATVRTDNSSPVCNQKTANALQAHPDVTVILTGSTTCTQGIVPALRSAGKLGKIKVYEYGSGIPWELEALEKGWIESSTSRYPRTMIRTAIQHLQAVWKGEKTPHFVPNDGHPPESGRKEADPVYIVTKDNVDTFTPES